MLNKVISLIKTMCVRLTFRGEPSPECWVFSSVHNRTFNYNSSYLFLYVKEHCPDIHPYYVMNDEKKRKELEDKYGKEYFIETNSFEGIRKVLTCKVWFTSTAPPLYGVGFRKKYKIINLWHGVPLKTIGMEQGNLSWFTRKYYKYLFADNYEAVVTTAKEMIPVMSRSFLVDPERVKVWGQPRNDLLFVQQVASHVLSDRYEEEETVIQHSDKFILYAPTFRDHEPTKLFPFSEFEAISKERERSKKHLLTFLETNKIFLCIRMHLYDTTGCEWLKELDKPGSRIRFLNEDRADDIMEILNIFDLLITDYSSIYIDYLLTEKPVVFLPYDREEYLKDRGLNFDYDKVTPGPKPKTFSEFLNSIYDLLYNHDSYEQLRKETNHFFNEIQAPCCKAICDHIRKMLNTDKK